MKAQVGEIVLVKVTETERRPLIITAVLKYLPPPPLGGWTEDRPEPLPQLRVSGTLFCEPEDRVSQALRELAAGKSGDPSRVSGLPDRLMPLVYAECLAYGTGPGQWITRPTQLPAKA